MVSVKLTQALLHFATLFALSPLCALAQGSIFSEQGTAVKTSSIINVRFELDHERSEGFSFSPMVDQPGFYLLTYNITDAAERNAVIQEKLFRKIERRWLKLLKNAKPESCRGGIRLEPVQGKHTTQPRGSYCQRHWTTKKQAEFVSLYKLIKDLAF